MSEEDVTEINQVGETKVLNLFTVFTKGDEALDWFLVYRSYSFRMEQ